ncbi:MAG TPA: selenocysteine-specific translation elongation factor [Actinobacteria bacterium]|nr:selenocysteine-specific translation elongation factor [Actinomycetota bacterium]
MSVSHFVIGTAGHIDHGKTELVKALTGTDTDRLAEEKRRGISIDIGFASFFLPSGLEASIVDVPGHERFVKNMLAGSTGIDLMLLVVAADDGVMAQTKEHLAIAGLLGIRLAVVAITKVDMVEEDRVLEVQVEIEELLSRGVFKNAPVLKVSTKTGFGLEGLVESIEKQSLELEERSTDLPPRLPIDRSFILQGAGRIVTGTLWSGVLTAAGSLELLPWGTSCRPRHIEVRGQKVSKALAGQRVAIDLTVLGPAPRRGDFLVAPATFRLVNELIAKVRVLPEARVELKKRKKLRLYHGTKEVFATVSPIGTKQVLPGQTGYIRLRLAEPIAAVFRDRFILRSISPITTIGGGFVLEATDHRRADISISHLDALADNDNNSVIEELAGRSPYPLTTEDVNLTAQIGSAATEGALKELVDEGRVIEISAWKRKHFVGAQIIAESDKALRRFISDFHQTHAYDFGASKEIVCQGVWPELSSSQADIFLDYFVSLGIICMSEGQVALADHVKQDPAAKTLEQLLQKINTFSPPNFSTLAAEIDVDERELRSLLKRLESQDKAVRVRADLYFSSEAIAEAKDRLVDYLAGAGEITVSRFKELLETTRKYAIPLIEYFDEQKVTRRDGDMRVMF